MVSQSLRRHGSLEILNVAVSVIAYCGGFPLLLWFGALYLLFSYWLDKYFFLRKTKQPPMYSTSVAMVSTSLIPVGVLIHACLSCGLLAIKMSSRALRSQIQLRSLKSIWRILQKEYEYPRY
mmetsp:Transcript_14244/g.35998  ORF Transcript_14244/g.35998 Transcript_14244/m.35998 type:complete len:122 (-) Transcript_14244:287-652(-)